MTITEPTTVSTPPSTSRLTPVTPLTSARRGTAGKDTVAARHGMTEELLEQFGTELDEIRRALVADLGDEDAAYIRKVVKAQRGLEIAARAMFYVPPAWPLAVATLAVSKIIDNMEIGHNVMHGQYDWMGDPGLNSRMYEWDTMCPSEQWRYSHNYIHHTFTNIVGKDRDIGYGILRMDEDQKWRPYYLGNPVYATLLMLFFEWGVLVHDLEVDRIVAGERTWADTKHLHRGMLRKIRNQTLKDYLLFPALTGPLFPLTLAGNVSANLIRNVWTFGIIFCGHFPAGVETFSEAETENESRGHWYFRQLLGSANITGSKFFHLMTGNLSHQIEHHLFPDIPARRYPQIAPQVREICERYGLDYHTGPLGKQLGSVARKICRLALPDRVTRSRTVEPLAHDRAA